MASPRGRTPRQRGARAGDADLDELLQIPPERFVAARNELAAKLKASGEREAASRIQGLSKPTVPVWGIRRLARLEPEKMTALLESGKRLRAAQTGGARRRASGGDLRAAARSEREALVELLGAARKMLRGATRADSPGLLERIESTLHSLATGSAAERELLRRGHLMHEARTVGFPEPAGPLAAALPPVAPKARSGAQAERQELRRARVELRDARREARRLSALVVRAERAAERLRRRARRLEGQVATARDEAAAAEQRATELRRQLDQTAQRIDHASARFPRGGE